MRLFHTFTLLALFFAPLATRAADASTSTSSDTPAPTTAAEIEAQAANDGIDLSALPNFSSVLADIEATNTETSARKARRAAEASSVKCRSSTNTATYIDVHTHVVPDWYRALVPTTGGNPTPQWNITGYLAFMAQEGIAHSVFAFSAPGANVYQGQEGLTIALARLINEQSAAYVRAYPKKLSFYAVVPLPYTAAAIAEARYALDVLGAAGIVLTSNYEGTYLGNAAFRPFFNAINKRGRTVLYVHPATPYQKINGQLIESNPTPYPTGNIEFYFETARTLSDLAISQTILNFTALEYVIPHVGGAAPAVLDRFLKSYPALYDATIAAFRTRFWWDSAGPTYYHQVGGLLAYGIPKSRLLFGTDYPYAPVFTQAGSLAAVQNSPLLTAKEKTALFVDNPKALFKGKIKF